MARGTGTIIELRLEMEGIGGKITCPTVLYPAAGQYLAANSPDLSESLPIILYPTGYSNEELSVAAPLPSHWKIGMELQLRGPLGKGFNLPQLARRIAIAGLINTPARLLPLAYQALEGGAAVAIFAETPPQGLPPEVEVLPVDLLPEAAQWADYIALEIGINKLPELRNRLGLAPYQRLICPAQILIISAMPCTGLAECGICAVPTRNGWSYSCLDGPVYDFDLLELG